MLGTSQQEGFRLSVRGKPGLTCRLVSAAGKQMARVAVLQNAAGALQQRQRPRNASLTCHRRLYLQQTQVTACNLPVCAALSAKDNTQAGLVLEVAYPFSPYCNALVAAAGEVQHDAEPLKEEAGAMSMPEGAAAAAPADVKPVGLSCPSHQTPQTMPEHINPECQTTSMQSILNNSSSISPCLYCMWWIMVKSEGALAAGQLKVWQGCMTSSSPLCQQSMLLPVQGTPARRLARRSLCPVSIKTPWLCGPGPDPCDVLTRVTRYAGAWTAASTKAGAGSRARGFQTAAACNRTPRASSWTPRNQLSGACFSAAGGG